MLIPLTQPLDLINKLFVPLTLHPNHNRQPAHRQRCLHVMVFGYRLEVRDGQAAGWFLQDVGKVLGHEAVEPFKGAEAEDPVLRGLGGGAGGLAKVGCVAGGGG